MSVLMELGTVGCILCKNNLLNAISDIKTSDACLLYAEWLSIDISTEFGDIDKITYMACSNCGLKYFYPVITGSPKFYDALSKKMQSTYYQEDKREYEFASRFINKEARVLDVGSGRGLFSRYVPGTYTGLDFNPSAIEKAAKSGVRVINEPLQEHAKNISLPYSVVTAFQVLEHMAEPDKFIEHCLQCLEPGGLLILSVPSEDSYVSLLENAFLNMPPHHLSRWTDKSLANLQHLFSLELLELEHEKLEQIHFESFVEQIANRATRSLLRLGHAGLIDLSIRKKIVDKFSRYLNPVIKKVYADPVIWPYGHSVTAVYRKSLSRPNE